MQITQEELDNFHRFATGILNDGQDLSWQELLSIWKNSKSSTSQQEDVNERIRQGIAEVDAGLGQPLDEFMSEFRQKHNFPTDA